MLSRSTFTGIIYSLIQQTRKAPNRKMTSLLSGRQAFRFFELLLIHTGYNNTLDKESLGNKEQDQREEESKQRTRLDQFRA